jgi:hypothetical protein
MQILITVIFATFQTKFVCEKSFDEIVYIKLKNKRFERLISFRMSMEMTNSTFKEFLKKMHKQKHYLGQWRFLPQLGSCPVRIFTMTEPIFTNVFGGFFSPSRRKQNMLKLCNI